MIASATKVLAHSLSLSWLGDVHLFAASSNTKLLEDKNRNHVMCGKIIVTIHGKQCFLGILHATSLLETVSSNNGSSCMAALRMLKFIGFTL